MNELFNSNLQIARSSLLKSGMNIGKDILGTMTNTLLFALVSGFMMLLIWFNQVHYAIPDILNAKAFVSEVLQLLCSGIGIILIIPVSAFITAMMLCLDRRTEKN
jgi:uncharacterized membrane protein